MRIHNLNGIGNGIEIDVQAIFQLIFSDIFKSPKCGEYTRIVDKYIDLNGIVLQIFFYLYPIFISGNIVIQASKIAAVFAEFSYGLLKPGIIDNDSYNLAGILGDEQPGDACSDSACASGYENCFILQPTFFPLIIEFLICFYGLRLSSVFLTLRRIRRAQRENAAG